MKIRLIGTCFLILLHQALYCQNSGLGPLLPSGRDSSTQAALLEKACQDSSLTLLYQFFDNWSAEISSNESEARNKWEVEAHKVFKAFYQPLQLDKIGCGGNEIRTLYQKYPYFIVQDTLYGIYVTETIPIGDDELVTYYTNRIKSMYSSKRIRKKELEALQRKIEYDNLLAEFRRGKYMFPGEWIAIPYTLVDSNISFRPSVSFPDKKIVYLTPGYKQLLNTFLGNQHTALGTGSIMQPRRDRMGATTFYRRPAYAEGESARRMEFIENAALIFHGHWGGYWQYETYPKAGLIIFDTTMQRAVVRFRFAYGGGDAFLEKQNGEWMIVSGQLTWME